MRLLIIAAIALVTALASAPQYAVAKQGAQVVAATNLVTDAKRTSGAVQLVKKDGALWLSLGEDFKTGFGPDVFVLLHKQSKPKSYGDADFINLGMLTKFKGASLFKLPAGADLTDIKSVVIWCRKFNVTFGHGGITIPDDVAS